MIFSIRLSANGLSLNSIGPKALGMGGAFIGLADDQTAVYWNPAGLSGQKAGITAFGTDIIPLAKYINEDIEIDARNKIKNYASPNLFLNYNFGKFSLGFGAFVPAGLGIEWKGDELLGFNGPAFLDSLETIPNLYAEKEFNWMSKIGVFNFSPAFAYRISETFSLGTAINVYYGILKMQRAEDMVDNATGIPFQSNDTFDKIVDTQTAFNIKGSGYGASFGLKLNTLFTENLDLGLSVRSPAKVTFKGDADIDLPEVGTRDVEMDIEWPLWIGIGGALRTSEDFLMTLDVQYSNWSTLKTLLAKIEMPDGQGGTYIKEQEMHLDWKNAVQIRFGLDFQVRPNFFWRGGVYHDPAPASNETANILFPSSNNWGMTTGFGYRKGNFNLDFGIELLLDLEGDAVAAEHNMPGLYQMDTFAFSMGFGYKFKK